MYAAAGGASLASRQARQRQRQQYNKNKQLLQQQKLAQLKTGGAATPPRLQQSRPFHQLPSTYLRAPQGQDRKLSAGQSKLLLPIVEGNNQSNSPHFEHRHFESYTRPISPRPSIRPDHPSYQQLHKSATATLPLNSQVEATPPATPFVPGKPGGLRPGVYSHVLPVPQDAIIVTPATPLTSPGHRAAQEQQENDSAGGQLERKCSFYRVRRTDAFEQEVTPTGGTYAGGLTVTSARNQGDIEDDVFYGLPNGGSHKWVQQLYYCAYCEDGSYCEHIECAQGRAAWLERGRRCSVQNNNAASCHRRWMKRNRIQDSSLGGSSDDEDLLGVLRGPSSFANAFLYVGLGTVAIGLVIAFVGTGEKGFKTVELRLIGPSLIGLGLICCILRICFCLCPSSCLSKNSKKSRKKDINNKIDADHTTSLLRGENKRVSIATKSTSRHKFPLGGKSRRNSKMLNEGMEALRQIATTSLFLQNESKPPTNRIVPIIKEPDKQSEAPLEMKRLETTLNISDITDDEEEDEAAAATTSSYHNRNDSLVKSESKLARQRLPSNQSQTPQKQQQLPHQKGQQNRQQLSASSPTTTTAPTTQIDSETIVMETSLMVVNPIPSTSTGISSLSPQPSSSRGILDLPIEKRQFLPPSNVPLVHTPPPGASSSPITFARPGPSTSAGATKPSSLSSSSFKKPHGILSGSQYAPQTASHSRNITISNNVTIAGATSKAQSTKTTMSSSILHTNSIVEPELVLSPAKLGQ